MSENKQTRKENTMSFKSWLSKIWNRIFGGSNNGSNNTGNPGSSGTPGSTEGHVMSKKALCVGINNYPGSSNDLAGCVNDCNDWAYILTSKYGFTSVSKLLDSQATMGAIKKALTALVDGAVSGDVIVFTYSGHGSYVVDKNGDEPDGKDETLYAYDGNVLDDELRAILDKIREGVHATVILDSCHSGTATRVAGPWAPKVRFMPPVDPEVARLDTSLPSSKAMLSDAGMKEILFTGCKATEYSYDAEYNGVPNGAFTKTAINALNKLGNPTYQMWYNELRKGLPCLNYPQTPQFEGSDENKSRTVFS